jgi:hypothetical protein
MSHRPLPELPAFRTHSHFAYASFVAAVFTGLGLLFLLSCEIHFV